MDIIVSDVGGTHARFAVAELEKGQAPIIRHEMKVAAVEHATFEAAYRAYIGQLPIAAPKKAVLAIATAITGDEVKLTNSPWSFRFSAIKKSLGLDQLEVLNDFGAIARSIPYLPSENLVNVRDGTAHLPEKGVISIVGAGTGLGVAMLLRGHGPDIVIETEGGHSSFAATDSVEAALLSRIQKQFSRVSTERMVAGVGFSMLYEALAALEEQAIVPTDDKTLWTRAIDGSDPLARTALELVCQMLGTAAGDYALIQGAKAVVIAGGIVPRFLELFRQSRFVAKFEAKGRFESLMKTIPIFVCTHPDPGLLGAATTLMETA